jgi:hypothetical protein
VAGVVVPDKAAQFLGFDRPAVRAVGLADTNDDVVGSVAGNRPLDEVHLARPLHHNDIQRRGRDAERASVRPPAERAGPAAAFVVGGEQAADLPVLKANGLVAGGSRLRRTDQTRAEAE